MPRSMPKTFTHLRNTVKVQLSNDGLPDQIKLLPTGTWDTTKYGKVAIPDTLLEAFVKNFNNGIPLNGVPIDEDHSFGAASGWITGLTHKVGDGLYAAVDWTKRGKEHLTDKTYKYISAEFSTDYHDPATNKAFGAVLEGAGLTNRPVFTNLPALVFSQAKVEAKTDTRNVLILHTEGEIMDLDAIRAKDQADLTPEEKTFLEEHKADLNEEELTKFGLELEPTKTATEDNTPEGEVAALVSEEPTGEKPEVTSEAETTPEAPEDEKKEEVTEDEKPTVTSAEDNTPAGEIANRVTASNGLVTLSASAYKALADRADEAEKMKKQMFANSVKDKVKSMTFSKTNEDGAFLPKAATQLESFLLSLKDDSQIAAFEGLVAQLPKGMTKIFSEVGDGGTTPTSAEAPDRLAALADAKIVTAKAEGRTLSFSQALREVAEDNSALTNESYRTITGDF